MSAITRLFENLTARVRDGAGKAPVPLRRAAYDNAGLDEPLRTLVEKVAHRSDQVTDADIAEARAAGLTEDEVFEIVVCAAVGQAGRQYTAALATVKEA
ncbi:hypothetical protein ACWDTP_17020 [Mycobacterium sp. NPDC003449]